LFLAVKSEKSDDELGDSSEILDSSIYSSFSTLVFLDPFYEP
jgi:hypothetical protein